MKVLHAPWIIAGISGVLARAQRDLGIAAESYALAPTPYEYGVDKMLCSSKNLKWQALKNAIIFPLRYDVFHLYHNGSLLGNTLKDIPWLAQLGRRIFFHFCGCDLRDSKAVIAKYAISACQHCWPMHCSPNRDEAIELARKYAQAVFVSTPDLLEFYEGAIWLPNPIDLGVVDQIIQEPCSNKPSSTGMVRIVHSPSSRVIKGTKYIIAAVEELRRAGYPVELKLIEKMTHRQALSACRDADLAIDQVLIGSYGLYAVEMMALGKPVICYIREDLERYYSKDLPIVRANIRNLAEVLANLLEHPKRWAELGCQGRHYVEQYHEAHLIAQQAVEVYRRYV